MSGVRRLVIFDVDGTLVDSQDHIVAAMAEAFAVVGRPPAPRGEVLGIVGLSLAQALARLMPDAGADIRDAAVEAYKLAFGRLRGAAHSPLFPGARAALDALRGRGDIVLGIATGKSRRGLAHVLSAHGLEDRFATCQVADDHPSKPHPSMIEAALAATGVMPEDAVMLGDTTYDVAMAVAAGVAAVGVSWGYHPAADLQGAGARTVLADFGELPAALDALWAAP